MKPLRNQEIERLTGVILALFSRVPGYLPTASDSERLYDAIYNSIDSIVSQRAGEEWPE